MSEDFCCWERKEIMECEVIDAYEFDNGYTICYIKLTVDGENCKYSNDRYFFCYPGSRSFFSPLEYYYHTRSRVIKDGWVFFLHDLYLKQHVFEIHRDTASPGSPVVMNESTMKISGKDSIHRLTRQLTAEECVDLCNEFVESENQAGDNAFREKRAKVLDLNKSICLEQNAGLCL